MQHLPSQGDLNVMQGPVKETRQGTLQEQLAGEVKERAGYNVNELSQHWTRVRNTLNLKPLNF
jgi:hypothetical protein